MIRLMNRLWGDRDGMTPDLLLHAKAQIQLSEEGLTSDSTDLPDLVHWELDQAARLTIIWALRRAMRDMGLE